MLAPAKAWFHAGVLLLISLEHLRIRTGRSASCRRSHRPSMVIFRIAQALRLHDEARARLSRWWRRLHWPSPDGGTARAAGVCADKRSQYWRIASWVITYWRPV